MNNQDIMTKLNWYQENDPTNSEVYNLGVNMASNLIKSEKWNMQPIDFDNITHDVAADLYNIVATQRYKITYWRAFVYRMLKLCYVPRQRKSMGQQVFDTKYDPISRQNLVENFVSNINPLEAQNRAENRELFGNVSKIVKSVLDNSKFANDPVKRLPLHISVALSLRENKLVYFHITDDLKPFVNIFVSRVMEIITEACRTTGDRSSSGVAWNSLYASELYQMDTED
jgi:hypothetical protein